MADQLEIKVLLDTTDFKKSIGEIQKSLNRLGNYFSKIANDKGFAEIERAAQRISNAFSSINLAGIQSLTREINQLRDGLRGIDVPLGRIRRGTGEFNDTALKTWASTRGWRNSLYGLENGLVSLASSFQEIISTFTSYDDALRRSAAVTGDFENAMIAFDEVAKRMGETTRYTAIQAAEGLQFLAMAGLNVTQAVGALPVALQLAQAGNVSLGQSADIVTNVLAQYGFQVKDLAQASDVLVKTFTTSNTNLTELARAFVYTGSIAKATNQSFEQTNALLGVLANNGYKSGKAGRTLSNTLVRLAKDSGATRDVLQQFGVVTFDETTKQMRPLVDILDDLQRGLDKADIGSQAAGKAIAAFGMIAGPGIVALMGAGGKAIKEQEARLYGLSQTSAAKTIGELYDYTQKLKDGLPAVSALADRFNSLGINVQDAYGSLKSFPQLLLELKTAGVQASQLKDIFPDISNIEQVGQAFAKAEPNITSMQQALATTSNTSQQVAAQMESGIGGSLRLLISAWEALQLRVAEGFSPRAKDAIDALTTTINANRQTLADFISKIFEIIATFAEWSISIFSLVANNEILLAGLGALVLAFIAVKFQIIELSAVILGKMVVSLLAANSSITVLLVGIYRLITGTLALSTSMTGLSVILAKIKGLGIIFGVLASGLVVLLPIIATLTAAWLFFGDSIKSTVSTIITDTKSWLDRTQAINLELKALNETATKLNAQLKITSIEDMGTAELAKFKDELRAAVISAQGLEAINELSKEQVETLNKNKELLTQVNAEYAKRPQQERDDIDAANKALTEQKNLLAQMEGDLNTLLSAYERLYEAIQQGSELNIDTNIDEVKSSAESLIAVLERQPKDNGLEVGEIRRQSILAEIALENQRYATVDALLQKEYQSKKASLESLQQDENKQASALIALDQKTVDSRISNAKKYYDTIKSALEQARSDYETFATRVAQLEQGIVAEKQRQTSVLRGIERQGLTEAGVIADKKREYEELTAQYTTALAQGNLQKSIEIARQQEQLAQDVANAEIQAKEAEINKQKELLGLTDEAIALQLQAAKQSVGAEERDKVVEAQNRINEAMAKEQEIAKANEAAQKAQVDVLTTALSKVSEDIASLQQGKIELALSIVNTDSSLAELDKLKAPIEKTLILTPDGRSVQSFLDSITARIAELKSAIPSGQGFATGGLVRGKGTGTSDSIPALLSNREYVIPSNAVNYFGVGFLDAIRNKSLKVARFAEGGLAGGERLIQNFIQPQNDLRPVVVNFPNASIPLYAKGDAIRALNDALRDIGRR